jgi:hypothetical protein
MTLNTIKSYSVEGTWNVKSSTLELYYNVSSLSCTGMRDEEVRSMQTSLKDNNLMIDDLKDSKQAYGMPIELTRLTSGEGYMKLSKSADLAGNYTLVLAQ